jgi:hypothetical protein
VYSGERDARVKRQNLADDMMGVKECADGSDLIRLAGYEELQIENC